MSDEHVEHVPIKDLKSEEGAEELASSPDMKPYLQFIMAEMQGQETESHLRTIVQLPLEKRYVWRVASALKWAFADFDHFTVNLDRETLRPEDLGAC